MFERLYQGLTLIELLMVLTVAAILAAAAVPAFLDLVAKQRLKGAAETLYGHLQHARLMAIKENMPITVTFQDSVQRDDWCYGLSDTGPCRCETGSNCYLDGGSGPTIGPKDFRGIDLRSNFHRDQVTFKPLLGAGNAGTVALSRGSQSILIIVSTLGRVRMCSDHISGYPPC